MGIGVNVGWAPLSDLPYPATCLTALGSSATPRRLLAALAATLRPRLDHWDRNGFAALREDWLARAAGRGSSAALRVGDHAVRGKLVDVDSSGALRLEQEDGTLATFSAARSCSGDRRSYGLALSVLGH